MPGSRSGERHYHRPDRGRFMTRRIPTACVPITMTALLVLCAVAWHGAPAFAGEAEDDQAPVQLSRVVLDDGREVKEPGDDDQPTIIGRRRGFPHQNTSSPATPPPNSGQPVTPVSKASGSGWMVWVRTLFGHFVHILR